MEVKVPRDILKYEETLFFGLTLRQFLFSLLAVGVAVGVFFLFNPMLGMEMTSWICIVSAMPFALLGFVRYNGMTADEFAWTWIQSEILFPKVMVFQASNLYLDAIEQGRAEDANPKRKKQPSRPDDKKKAQPMKVQREKDFESRGRNIYKFRKRRMTGR